MGVKYYYSEPLQIRGYYCITDVHGEPIYTFDNSVFIKNLPRTTICSILNGNTLTFGFCTCSSKDQYKKKLGRAIAYTRALKKPYKVVELRDIKDIHIISDSIVSEILDAESNRICGVSN